MTSESALVNCSDDQQVDCQIEFTREDVNERLDMLGMRDLNSMSESDKLERYGLVE